MKAAVHNYHARMQRVLDHIDRHLDDDLDLDAVSGVAAFSKYHFHRQFTATFGLSVHRYVQLARMKRASGDEVIFVRPPGRVTHFDVLMPWQGQGKPTLDLLLQAVASASRSASSGNTAAVRHLPN